MVSPSAAVNDDIHSLVGAFPFSIRLAVHSDTARGTSLNIGNKLVIRCGVGTKLSHTISDCTSATCVAGRYGC